VPKNRHFRAIFSGNFEIVKNIRVKHHTECPTPTIDKEPLKMGGFDPRRNETVHWTVSTRSLSLRSVSSYDFSNLTPDFRQ